VNGLDVSSRRCAALHREPACPVPAGHLVKSVVREREREGVPRLGQPVADLVVGIGVAVVFLCHASFRLVGVGELAVLVVGIVNFIVLTRFSLFATMTCCGPPLMALIER